MSPDLRKIVPERRPLIELLRNLAPLAKDKGRAGKYAEDVQALLDYFSHPLNNDDHSWAIIHRMDLAIENYMRIHGEHPRNVAFYLGYHEDKCLRYVADRVGTFRFRCEGSRRPEYRGIRIYLVDAPEHLHLS